MKKTGIMGKASFLLTSSALALGFCLAAARPARAQKAAPPRQAQSQTQGAQNGAPAAISNTQGGSNAQAGHSYWKHPDYNIVLDLWQCPERGICARVNSLDPQDKKVRELVAKIVKKDPEKLEDKDVTQFCGYEAPFKDMQKMDARTWDSDIWIKQRNATYGLSIALPGDGDPKLHVRGYLLKGFFHALFLGDPHHLLGKTVELVPVSNPPPACVGKPAGFIAPPGH